VLWASGISFGFRRTIAHVVGAALGVGALVVGVGVGIGALLEAVPAASLAKVAGSVYLLWVRIGWRGVAPSVEPRPPIHWVYGRPRSSSG
jgi:threonine/homoserine/homoserine lactone efflux protein